MARILTNWRKALLQSNQLLRNYKDICLCCQYMYFGWHFMHLIVYATKIAYILSQSYNATLFYFDNIFHPNACSPKQKFIK